MGAGPGDTTVGDTLSIRLFQALAAAVAMTDRKVVLTDSGNFPSDIYMAQGFLKHFGRDRSLSIVAPEEVEAALTEEVGVLMLTQVDYRTGRRHDMAALTARAHELGIVTVWDLAHSAGAFEVDLAGAGADFAVGCTYKYLNGGPGAPAFIYVAPRHADRAETVLNGWLGHAAPFAFEQDYRPAPGVARMRVGTPAIVQMRVLETALDIWEDVSMADLRARSVALSERFIAAVLERCPDLKLASPRAAKERGSQVSFRFEHAYAVIQALIARGVVGDFRAPDIMRFGIAPLYNTEGEIDAAIDHISEVMATQAYLDAGIPDETARHLSRARPAFSPQCGMNRAEISRRCQSLDATVYDGTPTNPRIRLRFFVYQRRGQALSEAKVQEPGPCRSTIIRCVTR
jgi:kynureninase